MKRILPILLIVFFALQACKKDDPKGPEDKPKEEPPAVYIPDNSFKIVAYFYSVRNPDDVDIAKFKMMTHLNYAFLYPNVNGSLQTLANPSRFQLVLARAKQYGVKTAISLSGDNEVYVAMAADPVSRSAFVKNVVKFAIDNKLDGVDMDWEYPRSSNGSSLTYEALIMELSAALHKENKFLSAAITPGVYAGAVRDGITAKTIEHTDFFNIMVYDGAGWDKDDPGQHATYKMAQTSLDIWLQTKGMPKEKAVMGIPAYGKQANNSALTYRDLLIRGADPNLNSYNVDGVMYHYNGIDLVKQKALLAKSRANGVMMWELYQDANGANSLLKAVNDAIGRAY